MKARSKESDAEKMEFWKRHIELQSASKLTKIEYCKLNELNYHRFSYWLRRMKAKVHSQLIPVKINDSIGPPKTLCTINLNNGLILSIHSIDVLPVILDRMV